MTDRIAEIRQQVEAASPGPWEPDFDDGTIEGVLHMVQHGNVNTIARTGEQFSHDDLAFIAAAREDVPWLLDLVERQAKEIAFLKEELVFVRDAWRKDRDTYLHAG